MFLLFFISCLSSFPESPNKQFLDKLDEDFDGDGYSEVGGDCDDGNPNISPAEFEVDGDGVDNNCDGTTS